MGKFLTFWFKKSLFGPIIIAILFILGVSQGTSIPLNLSLASLLPQSNQSVVDLGKVTKSLGGIGYLTVLLGPTEKPEQHLATIDNITSSMPEVLYSFYHREEYLLKDKYLYLTDYKNFKKLIKHSKALFTDGASSIDLISDDPILKKKRRKKATAYFNDLKSELEERKYFLSKDGKYAMFLIKPNYDSTDLKKSQQFSDKLDQKLKHALGAKVPYTFAGRYIDKVRDTKQFKKDIILTGTISMVGISILLLFGLGSLSAVFFVVSGVMLALGITVGMANIFVGQINILTGFLLAILGGLGAEYGIHFVRRYFQLLDQGQPQLMAAERTHQEMGRSLFSAALTSSIAFLILTFSDFKGFSELGIIAGLGILVIYFVFTLFFPIFSKFLKPTKFLAATIEKFGFYPFKKSWALPVLIIVPLLLLGLNRVEFEYDFERMVDLNAKTKNINRMINDLFERSMTPAVVLTTDKKQLYEIEQWMEGNDPNNIVDPVISLNTLLPRDMKKRFRKIKKLAKKVKKLSDIELKEKTGLKAETVREIVNQKPFGAEDLPSHLRRMFGKSRNIIYVYPKESLNIAAPIKRFSKFLKEVRTTFPGSVVGSGNLIFSDILHHIIVDGKIVLLMFLLSAFIVFWLDFRSVKQALILELQLVFGISLLCAFMGLFEIRFTILNIAMIPAVLAAGIDIGVHMMHQQSTGMSAIDSGKYIAQAVQLSVLTTLMGFAALFFAEAKMLQGIAWISVLGQISMYLICMLIIPVIKERFFTNKIKV